MRRFLFLFVLLGVLIVASATVKARWLEESRRWVVSLLTNEAGNFDATEVEGKITAQIFSSRHDVQHGMLLPDEALRDWLRERMENGAAGDVDALSAAVQLSFPHYVQVALCALQSPTVDGLLQHASEWSSQTGKNFTHEAVVSRARSARLGFECLVVAGQMLPDFKPELLARGSDKFYSVCPLCHRGQPCQIPARMRSVSLECPHCHRTYAMLALGTTGRYRYVNDFLTGYAPPAHFPESATRLDEMLCIWDHVVRNVNYLLDADDGDEENDAWQTALETQRLGAGDCEDASIYLTDWLIARGFEARVAVGRYAERGGHAWVIARLDGNTYLLEATNPNIDTSVRPLAAEAGARYVPDATIDRDGFYVRRDPSQPWDGDYWSKATWQQVQPAGTNAKVKSSPVAAKALR